MKKRLITGFILLAVLIPLVVIEALLPAFYVVAVGFTAIGSYEMLKLYQHEKKYSFGVKAVITCATVLSFLCGLTFMSDLIYGKPIYKLICFSSLLVSISMQLSLLVFSKDFDASDIGKSLATSTYVGFGVASLVALRLLGVRFIAYLFIITILTDVFAYFFGMLFGKHKMIERISPKKTWEGAVGGAIIGTLAATIFAFSYGKLFPQMECNTIFDSLLDLSKINDVILFVCILLVSLLTSVAGQIGDLVASRLKRTYGIKDFSNIFPGHGGFLDRFDSSILASMVFNALFIIFSLFVLVI